MVVRRGLLAAKYLSKLFSILVFGGLAIACTTGSTIAGNEIISSSAHIEEIDIVVLESFPVQINVKIDGILGDACTRLAEIVQEQDQNAFKITVTTKRPADAVCAQVLMPFSRVVALDVAGLPAGEYMVDVNGVKGEFRLDMDNKLP